MVRIPMFSAVFVGNDVDSIKSPVWRCRWCRRTMRCIRVRSRWILGLKRPGFLVEKWSKPMKNPWLKKWLPKKKGTNFLNDLKRVWHVFSYYSHTFIFGQIIGNKLPVCKGGLAKEHLPKWPWFRLRKYSNLPITYLQIHIHTKIHVWIIIYIPIISEFNSCPLRYWIWDFVDLFQSKKVCLVFHWKEGSRCSRGFFYLRSCPGHRAP